MKLFNFFRKNQEHQLPIASQTAEDPAFSIPKELFVEEREPDQIRRMGSTETEKTGIEAVYDFLQADYESKGYNHAMTNPDVSYQNDNIRLLKSGLIILCNRVKIYYEDGLREIEFHISSRGMAGLIDTVEELKTRKETILEHMNKVNEIATDMEQGGWMTEHVILSYKNGFLRGLAAISKSTLLTNKI